MSTSHCLLLIWLSADVRGGASYGVIATPRRAPRVTPVGLIRPHSSSSMDSRPTAWRPLLATSPRVWLPPYTNASNPCSGLSAVKTGLRSRIRPWTTTSVLSGSWRSNQPTPSQGALAWREKAPAAAARAVVLNVVG